jgi:hypothetical protein
VTIALICPYSFANYEIIEQELLKNNKITKLMCATPNACKFAKIFSEKHQIEYYKEERGGAKETFSFISMLKNRKNSPFSKVSVFGSKQILHFFSAAFVPFINDLRSKKLIHNESSLYLFCFIFSQVIQ